MDELIKIEKINGQLKTDSLNISEVFDKLHKHVIRDIETLSCSDEFRESNFGLSNYISEVNGYSYKKYDVTKDGLVFLVMGYQGDKSGKMKEAYIQCFNEMEKELLSKKLPDFTNPAEAAEAWAREFREKEQAQEQLKKAQPKIEFHDQLETSKDVIPIAEFANLLSKRGFEIGEKRLFKFFYEKNYLISNIRPFQKCLESKWMEVKEYTYLDHNEEKRIGRRVFITGKGQTYFVGKIKNSFPCNPVQTSF